MIPKTTFHILKPLPHEPIQKNSFPPPQASLPQCPQYRKRAGAFNQRSMPHSKTPVGWALPTSLLPASPSPVGWALPTFLSARLPVSRRVALPTSPSLPGSAEILSGWPVFPCRPRSASPPTTKGPPLHTRTKRPNPPLNQKQTQVSKSFNARKTQAKSARHEAPPPSKTTKA